jgi:hypothetical protein
LKNYKTNDVLIIIGLIISVTALIAYQQNSSDMSRHITYKQIKKVNPGMALEQVIAILGKPCKIEATAGLHTITCQNPKPRLDLFVSEETNIREKVKRFYSDTCYCCGGNKSDMQIMDVCFSYSQPKFFVINYPMLWVHFNQSFRVYSVDAKQYEGLLGLNERLIYNKSFSVEAPNMRLKNQIDSFIDENAFYMCFR